jgi:signal transduction histidine kinase
MNPPPEKLFDDPQNQLAGGLAPMEIMGALTVRLIHDLTNQLTILAGNAQVLEMVRNNPERLGKVIERIKGSATTAGELLDRFARFRQDLRFRTAPHSTTECLRELDALNPLRGAWTAEVRGELAGRVALESRWVAFAVWQTALQTHAPAGRVVISEGGFPADWAAPGHVPSRIKERQLLRCELSWSLPERWLDEPEAAKPSELALAVVYELIKIVDGWVHYGFEPADRHRFNLFVPLVH